MLRSSLKGEHPFLESWEQKMINSFTGNYRFLSNYYPCEVNAFGLDFLNSEAAYQSQKFFSRQQQRQFCTLAPSEAKHLANSQHSIRPDWKQIRVEVMRAVLQSKFSDPILRRLLADTYPHELVEGNTWGDQYWGVCNGVGKNKLGQLLMEVRQEVMESMK